MSKYDLQTIQALDDLELLRFAKFGLGSGFANYKEIQLTPEEMLQYLKQGEPFLLEKLNIDADLCAEWREMCGDAQCAAMLKRGDRLCSRYVGYQLGYHDWVMMHRKEYCAHHLNEEVEVPLLREDIASGRGRTTMK